MRASGGRQGVARGSSGGRHPCVIPKIYHRRPKSPPTELILEPLDANFAAQVPIFDNLLVNFMFFDRILWIFMDSDQIFNDFQHCVRCRTPLLARRRVRNTLNIYIYIYIYVYKYILYIEGALHTPPR